MWLGEIAAIYTLIAAGANAADRCSWRNSSTLTNEQLGSGDWVQVVFFTP